MRSILTLLALLLWLAEPLLAQTSEHFDVPYVSGGGHKQQLDLFIPSGSQFPTVLFVHEGSLTSGDRKDSPYAQLCDAIRRSGIACAAMSYRLFPNARWPAPAEDVAAAFSWLSRNIRTWGGDSTSIYVLGHSAGCLLASLVAVDSTYLIPHLLKPSDIAGVIAMGCRLNDRLDTTGISQERIERHFQTDPYDRNFATLNTRNAAVPLVHVGPHMPRFLVLIAETEQVQPPLLADAEAFSAAAETAGISVEIEVLRDRTHMSAVQNLSRWDDYVLQRILTFITNNGKAK